MRPITARYESLKGRPVLVTGGADGIGAALVEAFSRQGAVVGFLDIDEEKAEALIDRLDRQGLPRPSFAVADVRDVDALLAAIGSLETSCGPFLALVNNAGNDRRHRLDEITPDLWDERFALNLRPMVFAARRVAPGMAAAGGGSIVNLGSTSWMKAAPDLVAYGTAKAAVAGLTRTLARELGRDRIRVTCIAPDWVLTPRQREAVTPERLAIAAARRCLPDPLEPGDVAALVLWLAADDSRGMTGQTLILDAGAL